MVVGSRRCCRVITQLHWFRFVPMPRGQSGMAIVSKWLKETAGSFTWRDRGNLASGGRCPGGGRLLGGAVLHRMVRQGRPEDARRLALGPAGSDRGRQPLRRRAADRGAGQAGPRPASDRSRRAGSCLKPVDAGPGRAVLCWDPVRDPAVDVSAGNDARRADCRDFAAPEGPRSRSFPRTSGCSRTPTMG